MFDVRRGEARALAQAIAVLLLIIVAHTALETVRDSLLLTRVAPRFIGIVYVAVAIFALPAAVIAARVSERLGARMTLGGGLVTAAAVLFALFVVPTSRASVIAIYVTSALVGAVLVPLFWSLVGSTFTVSQGRRLLGPITAAGVVGGAVGSAAAAALLMSVLRVKVLLVASAGILLLAAGVLAMGAMGEARVAPATKHASATASMTRPPFDAMREEPFLHRIALLVVVSTAGAVTVDYFFKWTVARTIPHEHVAHFIASYYAGLNALALVAQLLVSGALVRRIGVATGLVVTPLLLLTGGVGALAVGGALSAVLLLRAVHGTLLNSVHRITTELVYLPVPQAARARAKPFIDGALARTTQATFGGLFLALGGASYFAPTVLAALVALILAVWLAVALTTRPQYLGLLRRAISPQKGPSGVGQLEADNVVRIDRIRVERLAHANLLEHFRLLGLRAPFDSRGHVARAESTERLLLGLLDEKLRQSLQRTFRLLEIAHPREDIHSAHVAGLSEDRRARANAAEFLDTLLRRRDQRGLRDLLRIVTDDLSASERVRRARPLLPHPPPETFDEALARLIEDGDAALASLAELHLAALAGNSVVVCCAKGSTPDAIRSCVRALATSASA